MFKTSNLKENAQSSLLFDFGSDRINLIRIPLYKNLPHASILSQGPNMVTTRRSRSDASSVPQAENPVQTQSEDLDALSGTPPTSRLMIK